MKKNFFKKLSFVLALAMIISVIAPAAGAFAAEDAHLNAAKKYLYLGVTDKNEYDFNIAHKQSGWKYAWTSSNEDVVTVDPANGLATAAGVGSAKVSVAITDKEGADVNTLSADVVVRDNIKTITSVYFQGDAAQDLSALKVATSYDFGRKFETVSGSTTKTSSVTRWFVNSDKATIDNAGVFKATEAGDYTITAVAFQSTDKYNAWAALKDTTSTVNVLASKTLDVKVLPSLVSTKQLSFTKAELTFDTDMSKVITKDNLKVYRVIANTPVDVLVKGVSFDTTGKIATVEMFIDFVGGESYKFVSGKLEGNIVAAKADADKVASVVLDTKEAVYTAGAKALAVKLYDANGVDITTAALTGRVTYELTNNVGYLNSGNLTLFKKGDVAAIKATFHTYKYDNNYNEIVVTGTGNVVAVDAASYTISSTVNWTLSKTAPDWSKATTTVIAAGDSGYSVWARIRSTDTSAEKYFYSYAGQVTFDGKITFSSSNSDVLIVDTFGTIYPVKAGSAVILCYYDGKAVATFPVEIKEARTAAVFSMDKNATTLSNSASVAATDTIKFTIKDQLGADLVTDASKIKFEALASNPVAGNGPLSWTDATHMQLSVNAAGATKGTYTYKITAYDKVQILVVNIEEPSSATVLYYQLSLDKTSVDTVVSNDGAVKSVTPTLLGIASNGVATFKATWGVSGYAYTVTKDGSNAALTGQVLTDGTIEVAAANGVLSAPIQNVSGPAITAVSGSAVAKLDNGSYLVTATLNGGVVGTFAFAVTNTQPVASYVLEKSETTTTTVLAAARDCFKVQLSGSDIADNDLYSVEYVLNGATYTDTTNATAATAGNYFVKSVKFIKTYTKDGVTYAVEYKVDINRTIVVK